MQRAATWGLLAAGSYMRGQGYVRALDTSARSASWLLTGSLCHAVLRGSGIAWHVFSARVWNLYMAALLLDWGFCLLRVMVRRRIRHIPRKELVWDIAGICTGDATSPDLLQPLSHALWRAESIGCRSENRASCSGGA